MKRFQPFLLVLWLMHGSARADGVAWITDYAKGIEQARREEKPVLVDFFADWCGWCKVMDRTTYADNKVVERLARYICIKIDVTQDTDTALMFHVGSLPRSIVMSPDGRLLADQIGYMDGGAFAAFLDAALADANPDAPFAPGRQDKQPIEHISALAAKAASDAAAAAELALQLDHDDERARRAALLALQETEAQITTLLVPLLANDRLETRILAHTLLQDKATNTPPYDPWAPRPERTASLEAWALWSSQQAESRN